MAKVRPESTKSKLSLSIPTKWYEYLKRASAERDMPLSVLITLALEKSYGDDLKHRVKTESDFPKQVGIGKNESEVVKNV